MFDIVLYLSFCTLSKSKILCILNDILLTYNQMNNKIQIIEVQNIAISISKVKDDDFICLTDMAKAKEGDARAADIIKNWIRNRSTLEFLGTWEQMYNPDFKVVEFDHFRMKDI